MTTTPSSEPTLTNVIEKLDKLAIDVEQLSSDVEQLSSDVKKFDERFADYRQATQWVVQLAFTLIASATITVIITAVFRK
jgi:hypothetical protein